MFESSIPNMDAVVASLQKWINEIQQSYETRKITAEQRMKAFNRTIEDANASPVERLRALVGNVVENGYLQQASGELVSLNYSLMVALSMRMFQEEVAFQLNLLKAQTSGQSIVSEESHKYIELKKELQKIKRTMTRDWKPLMDTLKEEIERRRRFLDENR